MHQRRLALVHRREELDRGRRTGGACGKLDVVGRCHFDGGGEPDHFKYRRDRRRSAGFEKLERPGVAAEAAMVGGVVRFGLRNQGGKLRGARHAQQQHDKQCFPVTVEVAHYGNGQTVYKRDPQHLGYQNRAAGGRPSRTRSNCVRYSLKWRYSLPTPFGRRLGTVNEPELIEKLRERVGLPRTAGVVLGIGDDCAIVRPRGASEDWLYTTDLSIEGTHFLRQTHGAADVGWKALARALSDVAAMGVDARFCLLSLAVAGWVDARWVEGFYGGLLALAERAERAGVALIGGDLARTERVMCDIVVVGTVPRGKAVRRVGAGPRGGARQGLVAA